MSLFPEIPGKEDAPGDGKAGPGKDSPQKDTKVKKPAPPGKKAAPAGPSTSPYLALARKYRPSTFDEVVGQSAVTSTLRNTLEAGRLHHAYLFSGIRGVGKTTVARLFARALNCEKGPTPLPCGSCNACNEIAAGLNMDVIEIDAASNRGVDDVEPLREAARYAPSRDRYKVFILDEVHMLSNAAFNSLLKILEEPPPRIVWMLATTEYRKLPPTVVSRCQHFEFRRVPREEVSAYLRRIADSEGSKVSEKGLNMIAAAAGGSVRDAVSLLDQVIAFAGAEAGEEEVAQSIGLVDRRHLVKFLGLVASRDTSGLIDLIATLAEAGTEFPQFAAGLLSTIRDAALVRFAGPETRALDVTPDEAAELRELAAGFDEDGLLRVFNALLDLPGQLRLAPQPRFALEAAALRLARMADLQPIEDLISRIQDGDSRPPAPSRPTGRTSEPAPRSGGTRQAAAPTPTAQEPGPVAGATPPPPVRSDGGGIDAALREQLLERVQSKKLSLRTFLEGARALNLDEGKLEIVLGGKQSFFRQGLESGQNRDLIQQAAAEAFGRTLEVVVTVDADGPASPAAGGDRGKLPGKRETLLKKAMSEPGVKMVMDAFGGQIVDIEEQN